MSIYQFNESLRQVIKRIITTTCDVWGLCRNNRHKRIKAKKI